MISNTNQRIERKPAAIRSIVKTINFKLGVNKNHLLTQPFRFDKISYVALYLFECPGRMLNLITQSFRTGIKEIPEKKQGIHALRGSSNAVNGVSLIPPFYHPTLKGWASRTWIQLNNSIILSFNKFLNRGQQ